MVKVNVKTSKFLFFVHLMKHDNDNNLTISFHGDILIQKTLTGGRRRIILNIL